MRLDLWPDGSCPKPGGPGGYAAILVASDEQTGELLKRRDIVDNLKFTTNNRAELLATTVGLETLERPTALTVNLDSRYVMDGFEKGWVASWREQGWMRRSKSERDKRISNAMKAGASFKQCPVCANIDEDPGAGAMFCRFHGEPVEMTSDVHVKRVSNRDLWERLALAVAPHAITWNHVHGHVGIELNEEADRLAGEQTAIAKGRVLA